MFVIELKAGECMIFRQQSLNLSPYSALYDLIIPADHTLRKIKELVDISFVYDELEKNYNVHHGRNAIDPIRMFKYLFLKIMYDLSDIDVVEQSETDMSFKFFLDMNPEDPENGIKGGVFGLGENPFNISTSFFSALLLSEGALFIRMLHKNH